LVSLQDSLEDREELTCDGELGVGDVRTTHHAVAALVFDLAALDAQRVEVSGAADVVLVARVQLLGTFVPGEADLRVVYPDLALEGGTLVLGRRLVADVLNHGDGLRIQDQV